jgi:hypothetical protein
MRVIIIDRNSGYIFGDLTASNAVEAINLLNDSLGNCESTYEETTKHDPAAVFDIYKMPDNFPKVSDGTDQNTIEAVQKLGNYLTRVVKN